MHNAEAKALNAPWMAAVNSVFPPIQDPQTDATTAAISEERRRGTTRGGKGGKGWGRKGPHNRSMRRSASLPEQNSSNNGPHGQVPRSRSRSSLQQTHPHANPHSDPSQPVVPQEDYHDIVTTRETEDFLNRQPDRTLLDLSGDTRVSNPVLWQTAMRLASQCKSVKLRGNANLDDLMMRSLALCLGDRLEAIDAAGCPTVSDGVVQSLVIRLFHLKYINLSGCRLVTNVALKALADGCKATLTSVDVSRCPSVGDPGVAWLAGQVGAGESCSKLASLNLEECTKIRDRALEDLGEGCNALRFVNVRGCKEISNRGVRALAQGCPELRVVNIHGCIKVGDPALVMLGRCCAQLQSLCATRCLLITDRGLTAIGRGCPKVQSVTLAGCVKITEGGICAIAENCRGLQTLNVTGCIDITENGLKELLRGLPFVETARTYVGFRPKGSTQSDVRHLRLSVQHKAVIDAAASRIQASWVSFRQRQLFIAARHANVMFRTCVRIQRLARGARARLRVRRIKLQRHREEHACVLQEWWREVVERLRSWRLKQSRAIYKTQVSCFGRGLFPSCGFCANFHPDVLVSSLCCMY